jgi:hypothetical protein
MIRTRYIMNTVKAEKDVWTEAIFHFYIFHIVRREKAEISD